jgi:uncharacterized membrane protein YphA (DoxX/SURF4 family)
VVIRPPHRPTDDQSSYESATNWAVRVCVALVFAVTGLEKFPAGPGYWVSVFDSIGLGQWFRYFTGIVEVVGGLLFLVPGVTAVGAALLAAAMIGAMVVHIVVFKQPANILFPGAYLVGVVLAFAKLRASRRRRTAHE